MSHWNETYDALAGCYDDMTEDVNYPGWADFLEKLFSRGKHPVHTVLDLACGTGTMSFLLAARGYELIGVDFSPEMLAIAAEKTLEGEGEPPIFLCQPMEKLDLYGTVDACGIFLDETEDAYCVWRTDYHPRRQICTYGMDIFRREGEAWHRETEMHEERAYSVEELTNYLQQAGFVEIRQYGNLKLRRPEAGEERIFFTARKPKETKK